MHPATGYQLATAQITAHRSQAQRDQAVRAAKRARRARQPRPTHPIARWTASSLIRVARLARHRVA